MARIFDKLKLIIKFLFSVFLSYSSEISSIVLTINDVIIGQGGATCLTFIYIIMSNLMNSKIFGKLN